MDFRLYILLVEAATGLGGFYFVRVAFGGARGCTFYVLILYYHQAWTGRQELFTFYLKTSVPDWFNSLSECLGVTT